MTRHCEASRSLPLLEKRSVGSGTSSRSSRLIHGGIRYLELGDIHLVHEALAERAILLRIATWPAPPDPVSLRARSCGVLGMVSGRSRGAAVPPPSPRAMAWARTTPLSRRGVVAREPLLADAPLVGGALYQDARGDDTSVWSAATFRRQEMPVPACSEQTHAQVRLDPLGWRRSHPPRRQQS